MDTSDLLPAGLKREMDELRRKVEIAERALSVPEDKRTPWDILCASGPLTAQSRGIITEKLVRKALQGEHVRPCEDSGDVRLDGRCHEVKTGFKVGKLNIRQIRPWQDVDYIVLHVNVENRKDCRCYRLTHDQMMAEVELIGSLSHGTKVAAEVNVNREYSITISRGPRGGKSLRRWEAEYRDIEIENLIFHRGFKAAIVPLRAA